MILEFLYWLLEVANSYPRCTGLNSSAHVAECLGIN